jgi:hypothetical protein
VDTSHLRFSKYVLKPDFPNKEVLIAVSPDRNLSEFEEQPFQVKRERPGDVATLAALVA